MFPDRWPGAGLLLLRSACGMVLIIQCAAYFGDKHHPMLVVLAIGSVMGAVGLLLVIGFWTRFVALITTLLGIGYISSWFPESNIGPLGIPMTAALSAVIAVALVCMGPGALSLDARLFGRREIVIPPSLSKSGDY